jgi:hypothetical protein
MHPLKALAIFKMTSKVLKKITDTPNSTNYRVQLVPPPGTVRVCEI